jgi:hypothetical protein
MDIEIEKMIVVEEINRLTSKINTLVDKNDEHNWYLRFGYMYRLMEYIVKNQICKCIVFDLNKNKVLIKSDNQDFFRIINDETWYVFYRLYILYLAWNSRLEIKPSDKLLIFFDNDQQIIENNISMLKPLELEYYKEIDIYIKNDFNCNEYTKWAIDLSKYIVLKIKAFTYLPQTDKPPKPFPQDIKFDEVTRQLRFGKYDPIHLSPQQSKVFNLLKNNFGNPVSYKTFENHKLPKKSIKNTVGELKRKILKSHAPIEIKTEGNGYFLENKTDQATQS